MVAVSQRNPLILYLLPLLFRTAYTRTPEMLRHFYLIDFDFINPKTSNIANIETQISVAKLIDQRSQSSVRILSRIERP